MSYKFATLPEVEKYQTDDYRQEMLRELVASVREREDRKLLTAIREGRGVEQFFIYLFTKIPSKELEVYEEMYSKKYQELYG